MSIKGTSSEELKNPFELTHSMALLASEKTFVTQIKKFLEFEILFPIMLEQLNASPNVVKEITQRLVENMFADKSKTIEKKIKHAAEATNRFQLSIGKTLYAALHNDEKREALCTVLVNATSFNGINDQQKIELEEKINKMKSNENMLFEDKLAEGATQALNEIGKKRVEEADNPSAKSRVPRR